ncbi:MerR family transcriptional regulator [Proteiniclasticum sp.]|uniref:MerR family transcriptional regulator n=1 Tax=Proteiniclasticum sp. TaxID=2053595 RepID=UPI00289C99C6|nr:MerR family transcriptional regulator [Proteiniclasticum sp.]
MKIGKFAEKYGVTPDAIRYYIERGLLVAQKRGEQYFFTEADGKDLEKIIELKNLEFSLNSISDILTVQRLSGENTDVFRNYFMPYLIRQKDEIDGEAYRLKSLSETIGRKIDELRLEDIKTTETLGLPLSSLENIVCPRCGISLHLNKGSLQDNMVIKANLSCSCGYDAKVREGIFIHESAVRKKLMGDRPMPTKEEFLESSSPTYINYLYQTMAAMMKYMDFSSEKPGHILELNNCVGFFLLQYISYLPENMVYILVDYDLDRMKRLKKNLEMYYHHRRFIFLCCDYDSLPLKQGSVDAMVDYGMTRHYKMEVDRYLPDIILNILKPRGKFVSSSIYFGEESRISPRLRDPNFEYCAASQMKRLMDAGLEIRDHSSVGPAFQVGSPTSELDDMELYQLVVNAEKR